MLIKHLVLERFAVQIVKYDYVDNIMQPSVCVRESINN